ncbi:5'/3'-nucleotidase SurE [bacterium]|nr:5'/3'-nucleotidase SurE [bacterium]
MRILLTNDDGINGQGLAALKRAVAHLGDVTVVAPDTERSGVGHSITLTQPLRIRKVYHGDAFFGYGINGAPADCVKLACSQILEQPPDLLLSGINLGANAAINILYSGTVAAAVEGAMIGIPSVALSLAETERPDFTEAAHIVSGLLERLLAAGLPPRSLLNVNIPGVPRDAVRGVRVTHQSRTGYNDFYEKRVDPWGRTYYWITGELQQHYENEPDSDLRAVRDGYVSITPLQYDLTCYGAIPALKTLLESPRP